jgi:hypothetical protein
MSRVDDVDFFVRRMCVLEHINVAGRLSVELCPIKHPSQNNQLRDRSLNPLPAYTRIQSLNL